LTPRVSPGVNPGTAGFLRKSLSEDRSAVIVAADLTPVLQKILKQLKAFPPSFAHLGKACLGAVLMQALSDTDDQEKLELQWQMSGPFGNLYADALGTGKIRGTIQNLRAEVDSFQLSLGKGLFQVRRTVGDNIKNTGIIESKGSVPEDLKNFLEQSEQKTCDLHLNVAFEIGQNTDTGEEELLVSDGFGFLIHILPTDTEEQKQKMRELWDHRMKMLGPIHEWSLPADPESATRAITEWLTVGSKPLPLKKFPIEDFCTCSVDRIQRAIGLLTTREKQWIFSENSSETEGSLGGETISINCEFCGKNYIIRKEEIR
jgi:redox-regulated HSP33 family molecular chaperone